MIFFSNIKEVLTTHSFDHTFNPIIY